MAGGKSIISDRQGRRSQRLGLSHIALFLGYFECSIEPTNHFTTIAYANCRIKKGLTTWPLAAVPYWLPIRSGP
jgi:hypothetical protein